MPIVLEIPIEQRISEATQLKMEGNQLYNIKSFRKALACYNKVSDIEFNICEFDLYFFFLKGIEMLRNLPELTAVSD